MTLDRLQILIPPPKVPVCIPTIARWQDVQRELGVELPEELFRFSEIYGLGTFRGSEMTAVGIFCPGSPSFVDIVLGQAQRFRGTKGLNKSEDYPYSVFPEEQGLLPLGMDEGDVWLCWETTDAPKNWSIVVRWEPGVDGLKVFDMTLSEFLVALFERRIELPCWPEPSFMDDVVFVPYDGPL